MVSSVVAVHRYASSKESIAHAVLSICIRTAGDAIYTNSYSTLLCEINGKTKDRYRVSIMCLSVTLSQRATWQRNIETWGGVGEHGVI